PNRVRASPLAATSRRQSRGNGTCSPARRAELLQPESEEAETDSAPAPVQKRDMSTALASRFPKTRSRAPRQKSTRRDASRRSEQCFCLGVEPRDIHTTQTDKRMRRRGRVE